jgi:hypothetical protein
MTVTDKHVDIALNAFYEYPDYAEEIDRVAMKRALEAFLTAYAVSSVMKSLDPIVEDSEHRHNIVRYTDSVTNSKVVTCITCGIDLDPNPWECERHPHERWPSQMTSCKFNPRKGYSQNLEDYE